MTNAQPTTQATIQPASPSASPSAAHPAAESLAESASQAPRTDRAVNLPGSPDERHLSADLAMDAVTLLRAAQDPRSRYVSAGDHLVSEAFYFTDPEGNGIELYRDRRRIPPSRGDEYLELGRGGAPRRR